VDLRLIGDFQRVVDFQSDEDERDEDEETRAKARGGIEAGSS